MNLFSIKEGFYVRHSKVFDFVDENPWPLN